MPNRQAVTPSETVWVLSAVGGVLGALVAAEPTGHPVIDRLLCAALVAFTVWAGSTARTWLLIAVSGAVGVLALTEPVVGGVALATAVLLGVADAVFGRQRSIKAVASGITALVVLHLPEIVRFGGSAVVAAAAIVAISVSGLHMKRRSVRRRVYWGVGAIAALAIVGIVGVGATVAEAQDAVDSGEDEIRSAIVAVNEGDLDAARTDIAAAEASLSEADRALSRPWGRLGAVIPVVAQHRSLAVDLASSAHEAAIAASLAIAQVDLDGLRSADGRFDVEVMEKLGEPFTALAEAVDRFTARLDDNDSPWLVAPVRERLDEVSDELDVEGRRVANLAAATRQLPELFGAEGERRYFVAFITPSEARALGGHMANYAELTIADGRMSLSRFGRAADLIEANADRSTRVLSGPDAYLDRYGVFGAGGDGVPTVPLWWLSVTISPDFPSVAEVIAEMYENGTGREVDGVLAIDPTGLAGLLRVTGPVDVPSLGRQLTADNVVDFLQREQYLLFGAGENEERADLLGEVARTTFDSFVSSGDADPVDLVKNLAPAVSAGHFLAWSDDFGEQQLFTAIGASGSFARQGLRDGLAVTNLNVSANKIDAFLTRTVSYHAVMDEATGEVTGRVDVTLTNGAPADGLPAYVIGNSVGLPPGYNQTFLTLYTAGDVTGATVDGAAAEPALGSELGWTYAEQMLVLPPGSSTTASYTVVGAVDPDAPYELLVRAQPMAVPDVLTVSVTTSSGRQLVSYVGPLERTTVFRSESSSAADG